MNREIALGAASIYPLRGDVTSAAGSSNVTVTGLQGVPLAASLLFSGASLQYLSSSNQWQPVLIAAVQVNGVSTSDDNLVTVNVLRPIKINGV